MSAVLGGGFCLESCSRLVSLTSEADRGHALPIVLLAGVPGSRNSLMCDLGFFLIAGYQGDRALIWIAAIGTMSAFLRQLGAVKGRREWHRQVARRSWAKAAG